MDVNQITQLIMNLGFPIICCGVLAYYIKYQSDNYRLDKKESETRHKEEMDGMVQALNSNTIVLQKLCDKLDGGEKLENLVS